jgi:hypothetical protein
VPQEVDQLSAVPPGGELYEAPYVLDEQLEVPANPLSSLPADLPWPLRSYMQKVKPFLARNLPKSVPPAVLAKAVNAHHDAPLRLSYEAPVEGVEAIIEL